MPASSEIYNAQIAGTETKYSTWLRRGSSQLSFQIVHPAISTTYSVEATDSTEQDIQNGTEKIIPYDPILAVLKVSAETFGIEIPDPVYLAFRVKMVNTSGTGTPVIRGAR